LAQIGALVAQVLDEVGTGGAQVLDEVGTGGAEGEATERASGGARRRPTILS
jgi:hypothetical protein